VSLPQRWRHFAGSDSLGRIRPALSCGRDRLVFAGLDGVEPPIFGWILYPIEFIANTFVFPRAVTQVHGNGTALLFLSLLAALANVVYRLVIGARRFGRAAIHHVAGPRL
jgi:hypothetical protein